MADVKNEKKRELDEAQKNAVHINVNSVVSAGAGSGKTTVLAERFSDLLLRDKDCRVEQILTLTFTKKATVEMNDRIYKQLSVVCPEKAKDFYKANIKTLDSYCAQVAKLGCNAFGVSPDFSQDDKILFEKTYNLALQYILQNRNESVISKIRQGTSYDKTATELFVNFANEYTSIIGAFDWDFYLKKQYEFLYEKWNELCCRIKIIADQIIKALNIYNIKKPLKYEENLRSAIASLSVLKIPQINFDDVISEERNNFLNAAYSLMKVKKITGQNHNYDDIKKIQSELEIPVQELFQIENYIYGSQFVCQLIPYLNEFKEMVDDFKRKSGLLTFNDVSSIALEILKNNPELRRVEKEKYKYIMIDEFQDNNEMQKDLLYLISEVPERNEKGVPSVDELVKDKLFFVGDEKQSIYKFRGAEVSVFRKLSDELSDGFLELKTNYRSHQALIAAFNSLFGGYSYPPKEFNINEPLYDGTFYSLKDVKKSFEKGFKIPSYEAVYTKVDISEEAQKEVEGCISKNADGGALEIYKPRVTIAMIDTESKPENSDIFLDAEMSEAVWVTNTISELLKSGYQENDIAILFRSLTIQPYYEKLLLKKGISYKTEAVTSFFSDGPVNDIVSYLTLIAFKNELCSFTKVLHSPFVNLSFEEIEKLTASFDSTKELFLQDAEEILNKKSLERFNLAKELYIKACEISQTEKLTDLISFLWYDTGYRFETLLSQRKFMYNSSYDRLFELARLADVNNLGLAEFIDYVSTFKNEKLEEIKIPFEYADGVNLLTIHKSKGLEYPVVFVVGCGRGSAKDNNSGLIYYSKEYGVIVNTPKSPVSKDDSNFFYESQKQLSLKKSAAELRRVAYVAITRAEQRVYLSGKFDFSKWNPDEAVSASDEKPCEDSIFGILTPALKIYISDKMKIKEEFAGRCPFNFEVIDWALKEEGFLEDNSKKTVIENFTPLFENAEVIEKEILKSPYASPSQLHESDDETSRKGFSKLEIDKKNPYFQLDQIVNESVSSETNEPDFGYNNFGTIAHSYLECIINKTEPQMLNREIVGLHGNEKKVKTIDRLCRQMADGFMQSDVGKKLSESILLNRFYKSEYDFKSRVSDKIINGQIDLVFENSEDGEYTIVDYKTNHDIKPEFYYQQLACYRNAVSKMMSVPEQKIRCILFYLRYAKAVDITAECSEINLEDLIINTYN